MGGDVSFALRRLKEMSHFVNSWKSSSGCDGGVQHSLHSEE